MLHKTIIAKPHYQIVKSHELYNILKYMAVKGKTNIYLFSKTAEQDETTQASAKINKLDRYGYRDYLTPSHLTQDNKHLHF